MFIYITVALGKFTTCRRLLVSAWILYLIFTGLYTDYILLLQTTLNYTKQRCPLHASNTYVYTHTHKYTHSNTYTHSHLHIHTHTQTHTLKHIYIAITHTHILSLTQSLFDTSLFFTCVI